MKRCPTCLQIYSDETKFCRTDGAPLADDAGASGESAGTLILPSARGPDAAGTRTLPADANAGVAAGATEKVSGRDTAPTALLDAQGAAGGTRPPSKTGRRRMVFTAAAVLAAAAVACVAYYLLTRKTSAAVESIAVLPFANASGDAQSDYLADGLSEEIINSLARLPGLRVVPRSTVFRFKGQAQDPEELGRRLGVSAVLTGRVAQRGDALDVQAELVDVSHDSQMWGEHYSRRLADAQALQADISKEVSERLGLKLTGEERRRLARDYTTQGEAYQEYLRGRYFFGKQLTTGGDAEAAEALAHFNRAAEIDPKFAPAHAGIAEVYAFLSSYTMTPSEAMPKAKDAVLKALALDPSLPDAHRSLAEIYWWGDWNFAAADEEFRRAAALNANDPDTYDLYSNFLARLTRFDEAEAAARRSMELDPATPDRGVSLLRVYYYARRYDDLAALAPKVAAAAPDDPDAHLFIGLTYLQKGMREQAIAELGRPATRDSNLSALGYAYAVAGHRDEALKVIAELEERDKQHKFTSPFEVARVYVGLGDKERAFEWLQKAFDVRDDALTRLKDPTFDSLRDDPRFAELLLRVGLS